MGGFAYHNWGILRSLRAKDLNVWQWTEHPTQGAAVKMPGAVPLRNPDQLIKAFHHHLSLSLSLFLLCFVSVMTLFPGGAQAADNGETVTYSLSLAV